MMRDEALLVPGGDRQGSLATRSRLPPLEVGSADFHVVQGDAALTCTAVGSCICLVLWERRVLVGGMAHILLPDSRRYHWNGRPAMFADRAVHAMLAEMLALGARRAAIAAKIVGGATLFSSAESNHVPILEIGRRNTAAVIAALRAARVPILARDVGGTCGRSVHFSVLAGRVLVRLTGGLLREL